MLEKKKKYAHLLCVMVLLCQSMLSFSQIKVVAAEPIESKVSKNLNDYNVFLSGYHSADSADIEGPLAVRQDSSFGSKLETYSYGAMFNATPNTVGTPLHFDTQKNSSVDWW